MIIKTGKFMQKIRGEKINFAQHKLIFLDTFDNCAKVFNMGC